MRVIGYARVSSREQAENSHALEQQIERLKAAGAIELFADVESGSRDDRVSFSQVIALVRNKAIAEVVVTRLDRLTRSLPTLRKVLDEFRQSGVNLRALDDAIDISTAAGKFHINMLGALAEMEVDLMSERVRHGHQHHRDRNAAYFAPFGYRKVVDSMELDDAPFICLIDGQREMSRAGVGRDIIEIFLEYRTIRRTLRTINEKYGFHHYVSSGGGNRKARGSLGFSVAGFTTWLNNPILRGHLAYGRAYQQRQRHQHRWDIRYNTHPDERLMSEEEYRQIEEILNWNSKRGGFGWKSNVVHPLSGLIYCGECRGLCMCQNYRLRSDHSIKKYSYHPHSADLTAITTTFENLQSVIFFTFNFSAFNVTYRAIYP